MSEIMTEAEIRERDEVVANLAKALCDLTSIQDKGVSTEALYQGVVVNVEDEAFDLHSYLVKLLPQPLNF